MPTTLTPVRVLVTLTDDMMYEYLFMSAARRNPCNGACRNAERVWAGEWKEIESRIATDADRARLTTTPTEAA